MKKKSLTKKVLYFTGVCGIALTSLAPMATPFIDGVQTVQAAGADTGTLAGKNGTYSVVIHKTQATDKDAKEGNGNGEAFDITGRTAIGGIQFTITEVATDGVKDLKAMTAKTAKAKDKGITKTAITDKNGAVTFPNLTKGVYLVHETAQPGVDVTEDFLVQLPMNKVGGKGFLDTVNVYPKNKVDMNDQKINVSKKLVQEGSKDAVHEVDAAIGTKLSWQIDGHVPSAVYKTADDTTGQFYLLDPIRSNLTLDKASIVGTIKGGAKLEAKDFTVTDVKEDGEAQGKNDFNTIKIALTKDGLKKAAGKDVTFTLSTTINTIALKADGTARPIDNTVTANFKSAIDGIKDNTDTTVKGDGIAKPDGQDKPGLPTDEVDPTDPNVPVVHIGRFDITKVDAGDVATKLEGAEFKVAVSEADAKAGNFVKAPEGMPGQKAGEDIVLTTGKDGTASVVGLKNKQKYYLVETKAPTGYNLTDEIATVTAAEDKTNDATIKDTPDMIAKYLPVTGGQFKLILSVLGLAVVAGASTAFYVNYRKKEQA